MFAKFTLLFLLIWLRIKHDDPTSYCTECSCLSLYRVLLLVWISLHACCLCLRPLNYFPQPQWCYASAVDDMFWEQPWDLKAFAQECKKEWGVTPRPYWAQDKSVLHVLPAKFWQYGQHLLFARGCKLSAYYATLLLQCV